MTLPESITPLGARRGGPSPAPWSERDGRVVDAEGFAVADVFWRADVPIVVAAPEAIAVLRDVFVCLPPYEYGGTPFYDAAKALLARFPEPPEAASS